MGFDALFYSRVETKVKGERIADKSMSYLWRPSFSHFGNSKQIMTNLFFFHYGLPPKLSVDERFNTTNYFISDETLTSFNAPAKMKIFESHCNDIANSVRSQNIMIPYGDDFFYSNAKTGFEQMERIIEYVNKHTKANMTVRMSTPSEFIDAMSKENISWSTRNEDLIPYSST